MTKNIRLKVSFNVITDYDENEYQKILTDLNTNTEEYIEKMKATLEKELKAWVFRNEEVSNLKIRTIKS